MRTAATRRSSYRDLAVLDDREFIRAAYLATVGREPGESEHHFLDSLRGGATKARILRDLLRSEEGRQFGGHIEGFGFVGAMDAARSIPLLGPFVSVVADALNLPGLTATTRVLQARQTRLENTSASSDTDAFVMDLGAALTCLIDVKHQRMQREIGEIQSTLEHIRTLLQQRRHEQATLSSVGFPYALTVAGKLPPASVVVDAADSGEWLANALGQLGLTVYTLASRQHLFSCPNIRSIDQLHTGAADAVFCDSAKADLWHWLKPSGKLVITAPTDLAGYQRVRRLLAEWRLDDIHFYSRGSDGVWNEHAEPAENIGTFTAAITATRI